MARCSLGNVVAHREESYLSTGANGQWRTSIATPTTRRQGEQFPLDPIRTRCTLPGGRCRNDDGVLRHGDESERRECASPAKAPLQLERNVLSPSAGMTLALVTFSATSRQSVLFFILAGYTSASEIRDLLVPSSPDSTFSSILLQGAIRIRPQNTEREVPQRSYFCFWISPLQMSTFVCLSLQSPVVLTR